VTDESNKCEEYFVFRSGPAIRADVRFPALPLLRHGAQIVIAQPMPAIGPFNR
jgi:hypothetical protein